MKGSTIREPNVRLRFWLAVLLFALALAAFQAFAQDGDEPAPAQPPAAEGVLLSLKGAVTPANGGYLAREIDKASAEGKELVLIEIDTPGGLMDSMKTIIKAILASETPVVTYVSPQGARSASAGLYIMYAAHVSAMAPSTNTGAATPVEVGGAPSDERPQRESEEAPDESEESAEDAASEEGDQGEESEAERPAVAPLTNDGAMRAKVINDAVAYIKSLADERGRNAEWAERAVREAVSVTSREALELGVIDYVADDIDDLMRQIDGKTVATAGGEKTLQTGNIKFDRVEPTFIEKILGFIADPNVAVILMSLATTGIIIEMWNPGSIFPGLLGALCLVMGLYAFQVLSGNGLFLALMLIGGVLIFVEAFTPTFGLAGLTGLMLFAFGAYFLFPEGFRVSPAVIVSSVLAAGAFLAIVFVALVSSRSHGPLIGAEAIKRREGVVDDWDGKEGHVIVEGERWRARADKPLKKGDRIRVVEVDGLVLVVRQAKGAGILGALAPGEA